jgi:hypothetical protein
LKEKGVRRRSPPLFEPSQEDVVDNWIATESVRIRVLSLDGLGDISAHVAKDVLLHWSSVEDYGGRPSGYLHGIIPDAEKNNDLMLLSKNVWHKFNEYLTSFAESADAVYEREFNYVIELIKARHPYKNLKVYK